MTHNFEIEFEHDLKMYYATGTVDSLMTESIGGSYEGYDFERVCEVNTGINIDELYYIDENINDAVQVLGQYKYKEVEKIAIEVISDKYN